MSTVKVENKRVEGPEYLVRILSRPSGNPDAQWGPEIEMFLVEADTLYPIQGEKHIAFVKQVRKLLASPDYSDIDISAEPPSHMIEFKMDPKRLTQADEAFTKIARFQADLARIAKSQGIQILPLGAISHVHENVLTDNMTPSYEDDPEWGKRAGMLMRAFKLHAWREAVAYPVKHACVQMNTSHNGPVDMLEDTLLKYTLLPFEAVMCESALPFRHDEKGPYYNHIGLKDRYGLGYKALLSPLPFSAQSGQDYIRKLAERAYYDTRLILYYNEDGETYTVLDAEEKAPTFADLPPALQTQKNLINAYNLWWHSVKHPVHPVGNGAVATHNEGRDKDSGPSNIVDTFIMEAIPANDRECRQALCQVLREAGYRMDEPRYLKMQLKQDIDFLMQERHHFIRSGNRIADIPMADTTYGELGAQIYRVMAPYVKKYMGTSYLETFARKCSGETNAQWLIDNCHTHQDALEVMRNFDGAAFGEVYTNFAQLEEKGYLISPLRKTDVRNKPEP